MNTQQAYEAIREHFSRDGAQFGKAYGSTCVYFDRETGNKCAVGCLIPEELYDNEGVNIEGSSICETWMENNPALKGLFWHVDKKFLRAAQLMHDSVAGDVRKFVLALDVLAAVFDLDLAGTAYAVSKDDYLGIEA